MPLSYKVYTQYSIAVYTLTNSKGISVECNSFGATVSSVRVPDKTSGFDPTKYEEITLYSYGDIDALVTSKNPNSFGAIVGRVANRY